MEVQNKGLESVAHSLSVANRKLLAVEGVINLESYDQEKILLQTTAGALEIKGESLHIQQLNLDHAKVNIEGEINAMIYNDDNTSKKGKGFLSKLIK